MPENDAKTSEKAEKAPKTVTIVVSDAKSLALPRILDGVASVDIVDGKAKVPVAVAEELKRQYPQLVTIL